MIRNWVAALSWRRARAFGVLLLGFWAGLLATAGPAFLAAGEQMAVDGIVASRPDREEHQLLVEAELSEQQKPLNPDFRSAVQEMRLPGFDTVFERSISSVPSRRKGLGSGTLGYRSGVCAHLAVRGRCPGGTGEAIVEERFAADHGWTIGSTVPWQQAILRPNPERPPVPAHLAEPTGDPITLMVVGIYTPLAPQEPYWGGALFRYDGMSHPPTFTTIQTLDMFSLEVADRQTYLLVSTKDAFAGERLERLDAEIAGLEGRATVLKAKLTNRMGPLVEAAKVERVRLRELVASGTALLAVLIIVLGYLLAATDAAQKRLEHGVMRMRGVPAAVRWGMIMAMPLAPMLFGFAAGAVLAPFVLPPAWPLLLPGASVPSFGGLTFSVTPVAVIAVGLAVAMVVGFAARLRASTLDLLRGTGSFARRRLAALLEIVAVVLAAVMLVQLRSQQTGRAGSLIGLLAPAGLMLVGAILLSRLGVPLARRVGRSALRRGRVATALAALQVSRGPLYRPLLVTLTAGVASVLFALATVNIGQTAGERESELTVGAERVLTVTAADPGQLIATLETLDPQGRFAMAAATAPGVIAVDTARLRAVASWPAGVGDPEGLVRALRPRPVAPVRFLTRAVIVTIEADIPAGAAARLRLTVVPTGTSSWATPEVEIKPGRHDYEVPASLCLAGCRLSSFTLTGTGSITVSKMQALGGHAVPVDVLGDQQRWRINGGTAAFGEGALSLRATGPSVTAYLDPVNDALPLVSTAGYAKPTLTIGGSILSVRDAGRQEVLPRLLTDGVLVDLDYLDLNTDGDAGLFSYEVWLNGSAPADFEKLLRDKGLVVTAERRLAETRATAERRAPALAARIAAAGAGLACLACALGMALVGGLERRRQRELIEALATQGLRPRHRRRLTWLGYGIVGALSLVLGPLLAAGMFLLLEPGRRLSVPLKLIPEAPDPLFIGATWLVVAVAVMCAPAALAVRERMKR